MLGEQTTDEGLKYLSENPGAIRDITRLDLAGTKITDDGLKYLSKLVNLESINLWRTEINDKGLKHLEGLKNLTAIGMESQKKGDEWLKINFTRIKRNLEIQDGSFPFRVGDFNMAIFNKERADTKHLYGNIEKYWRKQRITKNSTAEQLTAVFNRLIKTPDLLKLIERNSDIPVVPSDITDSSTTVKNKQKLASIYPDTLEMMSHTMSENGEGTTYCEPCFTVGGQTTDEGLKCLSDLRVLTDIDLSGTKITDDGMKYLSGLRNLKNININSCHITEKGLKYLVSLPSLEYIRYDSKGMNKSELETYIAIAEEKRKTPPSIVSQQETQPVQPKAKEEPKKEPAVQEKPFINSVPAAQPPSPENQQVPPKAKEEPKKEPAVQEKPFINSMPAAQPPSSENQQAPTTTLTPVNPPEQQPIPPKAKEEPKKEPIIPAQPPHAKSRPAVHPPVRTEHRPEPKHEQRKPIHVSVPQPPKPVHHAPIVKHEVPQPVVHPKPHHKPAVERHEHREEAHKPVIHPKPKEAPRPVVHPRPEHVIPRQPKPPVFHRPEMKPALRPQTVHKPKVFAKPNRVGTGARVTIRRAEDKPVSGVEMEKLRSRKERIKRLNFIESPIQQLIELLGKEPRTDDEFKSLRKNALDAIEKKLGR
jgi:hypothetical protein